ncbi:hypothetical protein I4U23_020742 [Adineta vaga]|nr:hypothetical protein I4U23_020742 [Adineta vaga]
MKTSTLRALIKSFCTLFFRIKKDPTQRPTHYETILASSAIQNLPTEINDGQTGTVKHTIEQIPNTPDYYIFTRIFSLFITYYFNKEK